MREKLMKKLHSRRGASITFALLLFLVCAAIGSVVLASASATAGRVSENYDYDQRYYAVTSAAELLRSALDGQTVTFELKRTSYVARTTTTVLYVGGENDGSVKSGPDVETTDPYVQAPDYVTSCALTVKRSNGDAIDWTAAPGDLTGLLAASLVHGKGDDLDDLFTAPNWLVPSDPVLPEELTLTVEDVPGGVNAAGLAVTVKPTLGSDGSLTLTLQNATGDPSYKYKLALTLSPDVLETPLRTTETPLTYNASTSTSGGEMTTFRTDFYEKTETRGATVTWRVSEVGKAA